MPSTPPAHGFMREHFQALAEHERLALLQGIAAQHPPFVFKQVARFERFGVCSQTGVFEWGGKDFVFVPGAEVTLGWAGFGPDEQATQGALAFWQGQMQALNLEGEVLPFLLEHLNPSPLRRVRVGPMLVECVANEPNWERVPLDSPELAEYQDEIEEFLHGRFKDNSVYTLNDTLRLTRQAKTPDAPQGYSADLYREQSYDALKAELAAEGFALPTEDEWEYLCAAGASTLFRWGDVVDDVLVLRHFNPNGEPLSLELPNGLGLVMAHDPYQQELVDAPVYILKGGDGGTNICGGGGRAFGYLPVATSYRTPLWMLEEGGYREDLQGDFTCWRRVYRLG